MSDQKSQKSQLGSGPGNTIIRSRGWFFTAFRVKGEEVCKESQNLSIFVMFPKESKIICQVECGKGGRPHFQGCVYLKNQKTFDQMKKYDEGFHWEVCRDWKASGMYCCKEEGRLNGPWVQNCVNPRIEKKPLKVITELRMWQESIVKIVKEEPDDRSIRWYWESEGGVGKTAFAKYLAVNERALVVSGRACDVKFAVANRVEAGQDPSIVVWDIPRSMDENISYQAIEEVKNGLFFSTKYESGQVIYNCPHVLVFANFPPEWEKMSNDRWVVTKLLGSEVDLPGGGLRPPLALPLRASRRFPFEDEILGEE